MTRAEWLASLKPGDEVLYRSSWRDLIFETQHTVSRLTATLVICGGDINPLRIRRADGRVLARYGEVSPVDQPKIDLTESLSLTNWLTNELSPADLSLPVLRAMRAAYDTATAAESAAKRK